MNRLLFRPSLALLAVAMFCLAVAISLTAVFLDQPWLGLNLQSSGEGDAAFVQLAEAAPHALPPIPPEVRVLQLSGGADRLTLLPTDLIEEPDFFDTYAQMDDFFARQSLLSRLLRSTAVTVVWQSGDLPPQSSVLLPRHRPLSSTGMAYWYQLLVGFAALLIATWVFVLRPGYWGTRLFLMTGISFVLFTATAAVYSSRELALPGDLFRFLSSLNHLGANAFGCALAGLFLMYPRPLVRPRTLLWLPVVFGCWFVLDATHLAPDQDWGSRLPIMAQMLMAIGMGVLQWCATRGKPVERASLLWFALSSLASCSLFVLLVYVPSFFGLFAPLPQAYAFGLFLVMYLGIALGLSKYRLFDLGEWAYRVILWLAGIAAVMAMDATLLTAGLGPSLSLGTTVLLVGAVYFPFRQWLMQRLLRRRGAHLDSLLPEITRITFLADSADQQAAWSDLLQGLFDPLELALASPGVAQPLGVAQPKGAHVQDDGLVLQVGGFANLAPCTLRYAGNGARLFSTRDAQWASALCELMADMLSGRLGYEAGVAQERLRISRDLHDNIGARLLKMIHLLRGTPTADVARDAMKDLRTSIAALDAQPVALTDALADWCAEAGERCEAAHCSLQWDHQSVLTDKPLSPHTKATLEAVVRELLSNALKHASPSRLVVLFTLRDERLRLQLRHDGAVSAPESWQDGYGMRNLRSRLQEKGGTLVARVEGAELHFLAEAPLS
jgi:signal transduction histidine kinase